MKSASAAIAAERPGLPRVLGGISPIDPWFLRTLDSHGALDAVDIVAVHGPLDWNHWQIHEWPDKLDEIRAVTSLPIRVLEVDVSSFGAEEVQESAARVACNDASWRSGGSSYSRVEAYGRVTPVRRATSTHSRNFARNRFGAMLESLRHAENPRFRDEGPTS